mmetsp:Transcript_74837/g.200635  ORF Transcript_74837/g.200635 Transcript_74837/m.200635 type:complete len:200 (+) Transcript_74837:1579-2178(+)
MPLAYSSWAARCPPRPRRGARPAARASPSFSPSLSRSWMSATVPTSTSNSSGPPESSTCVPTHSLGRLRTWTRNFRSAGAFSGAWMRGGDPTQSTASPRRSICNPCSPPSRDVFARGSSTPPRWSSTRCRNSGRKRATGAAHRSTSSIGSSTTCCAVVHGQRWWSRDAGTPFSGPFSSPTVRLATYRRLPPPLPRSARR